MAGMLRVPRSRGALSGVLLVLLGAWGALVAFVGPYFHYAFTPDRAWAYTSGRLWLEIVPGIATVLGGLILIASTNRAFAMFGAWIAALAGAWFVVGRIVGTVLTGFPQAGSPVGGTLMRAMEDIGFFAGLGVVIAFIAGLALGRLAVVGATEAAWAERGAAEREAEAETEANLARK